MSFKKIKYIIFALIIVLAGLATADSLGFFNSEPYKAVSMGSHVHYVPKDHDSDVPINQFPTHKPGPDEKITPDGEIIAK